MINARHVENQKMNGIAEQTGDVALLNAPKSSGKNTTKAYPGR